MAILGAQFTNMFNKLWALVSFSPYCTDQRSRRLVILLEWTMFICWCSLSGGVQGNGKRCHQLTPCSQLQSDPADAPQLESGWWSWYLHLKAIQRRTGEDWGGWEALRRVGNDRYTVTAQSHPSPSYWCSHTKNGHSVLSHGEAADCGASEVKEDLNLLRPLAP